MEEDIIFEKELDFPYDIDVNIVYVKDGKGNLIEVQAPDDEEE